VKKHSGPDLVIPLFLRTFRRKPFKQPLVIGPIPASTIKFNAVMTTEAHTAKKFGFIYILDF